MAKDKSTKVAAAAPKVSKKDAVKAGRVTKPTESAKSSAKDTAKKAAKVSEKKSKKVKEPTPEPSSDEEDDDDTSASSDSSDGSDDDEEEKPKGFQPDSDSDEEDDSDDSEDDAPAAKSNGLNVPKTNGVAQPADKESDEDSDDSDDSDDATPAAAAAAEADSDDSDDSEDDEEEEEEKPAAKDNKKRKAEDDAEPASKKTKYTVNGEEKEATANLWVGQLSWNVDDDWLNQEFQGFGEIVNARVMTERDSGRSKGFGYVEFTNAEDAGKALEARQGHTIDGRQIRVDFSTPRDNNAATPQQKNFDRAKKFGDTPNQPSNTIFVGNLSFDADQNSVGEVFQEYGTVNGVRLPTDRETGEVKGYGYVEMSTVEEAQAALEALQGADVAGRPMRLDFAGARPERTDGGFGGRGGGRGGRGGRGGFNDRGGRGGGRGRGGFGDRGGRGGGRGRGGFGDRGGRGGSTNRGGFGDFSGKKISF